MNDMVNLQAQLSDTFIMLADVNGRRPLCDLDIGRPNPRGQVIERLLMNAGISNEGIRYYALHSAHCGNVGTRFVALFA